MVLDSLSLFDKNIAIATAPINPKIAPEAPTPIRFWCHNKLEIPALTFHRYVQELKAFISNFELDFDLVYDRNQQKYQLIKR